MADKEKAPATEAPEAPEGKAPKKAPKKKSKLPVLVALVAMLGGGGFFAMKAKGASPKPKPELGEIVKLDEILVNLKEPNTYARTDIALHLSKGFKKEDFDKKQDVVRDAIILTLSSKSLQEVRTLDGKVELKREIAERVNACLEDGHGKPQAGKSGSTEKGKEQPAKNLKPEHPDWDSQTGPVLKVYFSNFATQ